jgi:hypothetical protein
MNARLTPRPAARPGLVVAVAILCTTGAAHAQMHVTPGLWEQQISMKTDNAQANAAMAQMKEKLASMPPEQRKALEQMMASHGMGAGSTTNSIRVCITKEQAQTDLYADRDGHCPRKVVAHSSTMAKFSFVCGAGTTHMITGEGTVTATSATTFTAVSDADSIEEGKPSHMHSDISARFISPDCGDVKPILAH